MAFSYSGNPAASDLDYVRFRVGDTNSARFFLHDAEITALVTEAGNKWAAAAKAADAIAGYFAPNVDTDVGTLSIKKSQRYDHYVALAATLRREAITKAAAAAIYAGGQSIAERDTDLADTDLVQPAFNKDFDRNPGSIDTVDT